MNNMTVPDLPRNQMIVGDCLEVMTKIPEQSIDLIVTSPPYNVGMEYEERLFYDEYLTWFDLVLAECFRVLKQGARICINLNDTGRNPYYPLHCDVAARMRKYWYMMGIIIWNKGFRLNNTAWGSWMSPTAPSLRGSHEFIIVAGKGGKKFEKEGEKHDWSKNDFLDATSEIWTFPPETRDSGHPAPFPEELPKRLIKLYTYKHDLILDPFLGSGTTALVAKKLECDFIGIDKEEKYAAIARKRIEPWLGQKRLEVAT